MYLNLETTSVSLIAYLLFHLLYSHLFFTIFIFILKKIEDEDKKSKITVLNTVSLKSIQNIYSNLSTLMYLVG